MEAIKNITGNILIVEDSEISALILETTLENDFNTQCVTNGYDAIEKLDEAEFDVVLMDINLGDEKMDGIRTMRMIKQKRKHKYIKIFAVTCYSDDEQWFIKQGFDGLFVKPVTDNMVDILKENIAKQRTKIIKLSSGIISEVVECRPLTKA